MANSKKKVDWAALEMAYRTGRSFRVLAREFGISSTRIAQMVNQENWARDLSSIIAEKARAKLNAANLNSDVNSRAGSERAVVEATVQVQTEIVLAHRRDIQRARKVTVDLLGLLEKEVATRAQCADGAGNGSSEDGAPVAGKPTPLAVHANTVKSLGEALKTLIALERQAFSVADALPKCDPALEDVRAPLSRSGMEELKAAFLRRLNESPEYRARQLVRTETWVPETYAGHTRTNARY